jgi:ABC-type Mn2+/Zn2+ transport system ATPase subunit
VVAVVHELALAREHFVNAVLLNTRLIASGEVASVLTPHNINAAYRGGHCAHTDDPLKLVRTATFPK